MKKCSFLFVFLFPMFLFAQKEFINFQLKHEIASSAEDKEIHLAAFGNTTLLRQAVKNFGGQVLASNNTVLSFRIAISKIEAFSQSPGLDFIEFSGPGARPMNDEMLTNSRIHPLHLAQNGLDRPLTGKDVIVGIIDAGLELEHPDFWHENGSTRVLAIWDHTQSVPSNQSPANFGYGVEWLSAQIDNGECTHQDQNQYFGHGSTVSGTLTGNGQSINEYKGAAPEADIVVVSANFSAPNFTLSIVDAIEYIFHIADTANKPCVINLSLGDYSGSRDGLDAAALLIDSMITAQPGRVVVCAAGNSGNWPNYHLSYEVSPEPSFTWFQYQNPSAVGVGAVFFELWADTADFQEVEFAFGADKVSPNYSFRGATTYSNIEESLNTVQIDTIKNGENNLAIVEYMAQLRGGQYLLQVVMAQPDSSQYYFRFITSGTGTFDIWSTSLIGTSNIISNIPSQAIFPPIIDYKLPDNQKQTVSSWACSSKVLTVGNYMNRDFYIDYNGNIQNSSTAQGVISINSSRGPTRDLRLKPDLSASGDRTLSSGKLNVLAALIANEPHKVAPGGMHYRNGGTSMASPVVSGVAALLLELCPNASSETIFNAIVDNVYLDNYTGQDPNFQYGNGKTDANQAMLSLFFKPQLNQPINVPLCVGDNVEVSALLGYENYEWSTGENGPTITVSEPGLYSLKVMNELGCIGYTDTIEVELIPLPEVDIWPVYDTLYTEFSGNWTYQWYLNGSPVEGATIHYYVPTQSGSYLVIATDDIGCSNQSEIFDFVITEIEDEGNSQNWKVFPNPFVNDLTLYGSNKIEAIKIWDVNGRLLYFSDSPNFNNEAISISTLNWTKGMYVVAIQTSNSVEIIKTICQ